MNKTIEEATREQIHELSLAFTKELHDDETIPYHTCKDALSWLFTKPLAQRLTAEEKESIRETYKYHLNAIGDCYTHCMVRYELEHIFGKDFFKEENKNNKI